MTTLLTVLAGSVVALAAAARIPAAAANLIRACLPLIAAWHEIRAALIRPPAEPQHSAAGHPAKTQTGNDNEDLEGTG
jgi:hypothetical protein